MKPPPDTIRSDVMQVLQTVTIVSASAVRFADEPPVALPPDSQAGSALLTGLQSLLYNRCYSHRISGPSLTFGNAPDPEHPQKLSSANRAKARWDQGWQIYQMAANGQISVLKGDRQRPALPGEYILSEFTGAAPLVGSTVTLHIPRESFTLQPGFYYMFSEVPTDIWDENFLIRFYFSCTPQGVLEAIAHLTSTLNRFQVPYRMKALTNSMDYTRTDTMVLYCARRYFPLVARIIHSAPKSALEQLKPTVPLFTRALRPGVAIADDPGDGQSFGLHRCGILAEAMIEAWQQKLTDPDSMLAVAEARFAHHGLPLDKPYLSGRMIDVFELAEGEAYAA